MQNLDIVIVNYNTEKLLRDCISSVIKETEDVNYKIHVVDNASQDNTQKMLSDNFPNVNAIFNEENVGFARANNQAITKSSGDIILLLNPDTIVVDKAITKTFEYMLSDENIGVVGCKVLNRDGTLQLACRRSIPTPKVAFYRLTGLSRLFPKNKTMAKYNLTYLKEDEISDVEAVSGAFLMIRRSVVDRIGMLDERFFMFGEELDLCYRVKQAGYSVKYFPKAEIIHLKGESSKTNFKKANREFYNAMILFHKKHFADKTFFLVNLFITTGIKVLYFLSLLRKTFSKQVGSKK